MSDLKPEPSWREGWTCEMDGCDEGSPYGEAPAFIEEDGGKEACSDCFDEWFESNVVDGGEADE